MSAERDQEVFDAVEAMLKCPTSLWVSITPELLTELLAIAKKWRSKALMRAANITHLEQQIVDLQKEQK